MSDSEKLIHVKCPCCGKRLFNMASDATGTVSIKCDRCKSFVAVTMKNYHYYCYKTQDTI